MVYLVGYLFGFAYFYWSDFYRLLSFLHTAAVGNPRTSRVRGFPTAKVCKNSQGTILTVFLYFIYRFQPPKMLKYVRTYQNNTPQSAAKPRPGQRLLCLSGWVRFYRDERPGVSFQYLYRLLWRIPIVQWNSLKPCFYVSNRNAYGASSGVF